jgi:thiamine-monophosphate kinase
VDVSELGEFALIERLTKLVGANASPDVVVGPGDDAAVWRSGDDFIIATTDTMVEGLHFDPRISNWADVGWKALATNVSDIAAMGGAPTFALVTLALPKKAPVEALDSLYEGLNECALVHGVVIAGGDVVRAPQVVITVAMIGRAVAGNGEPLLLRRNTAHYGDTIAVTGRLGDSAGGLRQLRFGASGDEVLPRRHMRPTPRVAAGLAAVRAGVTCGIDVSDGLLQDLGHLCEASGVGATIRASDVPLSGELRAAYPDDALELACTGGEDYELILVGSQPALDGVPALTVIGEIVDGPPGVHLLDNDGNQIKFERPGWDAFRS